MAPYDIVGYTYKADVYCPECIVKRMNWRPLEDRSDAETALDDIAHVAGIDRGDEWSFDSGEFPKVVFRDQLTHFEGLRCGRCRSVLGR